MQVLFFHSCLTKFSLLQVDDLQEETHGIGQLFGERGLEGGHLLLPPNDGGQQ